MKKWHTVISLLLMFAIGAFAGAFGTRIVLKQRFSEMFLHGPPGLWVMQRMLGRLDLSEAQKSSIQTILETSNKKWEELRQKVDTPVKELFQNEIEEIKKELTDPQRKEIERMLADIRQHLPPGMGGAFHPPGNPDAPPPPFEGGGPGHGPHASDLGPAPVEQIMEALNVDSVKAEEVRSILRGGEEARGRMEQAFHDARVQEGEKFRQEMTDLSLATEKRLSEFLSAEQMQTYKALTEPPHPPEEGPLGHPFPEGPR